MFVGFFQQLFFLVSKTNLVTKKVTLFIFSISYFVIVIILSLYSLHLFYEKYRNHVHYENLRF